MHRNFEHRSVDPYRQNRCSSLLERRQGRECKKTRKPQTQSRKREVWETNRMDRGHILHQSHNTDTEKSWNSYSVPCRRYHKNRSCSYQLKDRQYMCLHNQSLPQDNIRRLHSIPKGIHGHMYRSSQHLFVGLCIACLQTYHLGIVSLKCPKHTVC
jgi:hypothetical protein